MRDGRTKRLDRPDADGGLGAFLDAYDARLVVIGGEGAGSEFRLQRERYILGRGPGVDVQLDDEAMSRQHAAVEYDGRTFRIRDLGSTNGILVNRQAVQVAELAPGDRIGIGSRVIQYVVEPRDVEPEVYELPSEG